MLKLDFQSKFVWFVSSKKFDIALIILIAGLAISYHFYISQMAFPLWDGAIYLENAQNWMRNQPLEAAYRPPIISWIIAGIWSITGEDWTIAKYIQPIFTIGAGVVLYQTLKKYKGNFFAFGVTALTLVNGHVFFWNTQILTEGLSLFFLVVSVYFLKSEKQYHWIIAGIAIGLTFGSRYPISVLAITLFIIEVLVRRNGKKLFANTLVGMVPIILLIVVAVYIKSGSFSVAIERDTETTLLLSPFYLEKFIRIFGFISLLLPLAFIFRRTYVDKYNYLFIAWFIAGFSFWSAIHENQQERFMFQIIPAAYFLTILAIESLWKRDNVLSVRDIRDFLGTASKRTYLTAIKCLDVLKSAAFFPFRYYLCAFIIACISLSYLEHIISLEEEMLQWIFRFFDITTTFIHGQFYAKILGSQVAVVIPIYVQLIFLIFFPTTAIASRINIKKRIQFLSFGLVCFSAFVIIELLAVFLPLDLSSPIRHLISILITVIVGGLIIELSLWRAISIPKPTRIKRILKRNYAREYIFLSVVAIGSILFTVSIFMFLRVALDSPIMIYAIITLSSVVSVSYLLGNLIYEINRQTKRRNRVKANSHSGYMKNVTISFLIPAYNEEQIIGKCIESIDRAAARYNGRTEIVIVNDGSTDNTEKIILDSLRKLIYARGKNFTITNSGKGFALDYGLKRTSGDIVFRMDADSLIDKEAITPLVEHFEDPSVGSVSGFVFPLKAPNVFSKAQNILYASYLYVKRTQEVFDSIIVQPGPSTAFRKDALLKIGGWTHNQFGEDGEISSRMARFGYKSEFEQRSIVYTDLPQTLRGFLIQRSRWSIAYYHSRGRNLEQVKELASPRALVFMHNLESHGAGFGLNFAWVLLAASIVTGNTNFFFADLTPPQSFLATVFIKLTALHAIIMGAQVLLYGYALKKVNRLGDIRYYLVMRLLYLIVSMWVKILATEAILSWSSKWPIYNDKAFRDLRNYMHRNIDPNYPEADTKESNSFGKGPLSNLLHIQPIFK
jgi:cellulose synthase/poly-beta-1,6-N-acetylglucosamine synthase-like glycosyltransferase